MWKCIYVNVREHRIDNQKGQFRETGNIRGHKTKKNKTITQHNTY